MKRKLYDKGVSTILNNCCQWSQIFLTRNIGSMKERFLDFLNEENNHDEQAWNDYLNTYFPQDRIDEMTDKAWACLLEIRENINLINRSNMEDYIKEILFNKTYNGLMNEIKIFQDIANKYNYSFRPATADEEKQYIDGWLDNKPVQIKPLSYKSIENKTIKSNKTIYIIFYKGQKDKLEYDFNKEDFDKYTYNVK